MMFIDFVKAVAVMIQIILSLVILVIFTAFAMMPTEILLFTNALILVMILVQIYTVNTITDLYKEIERLKVVKKK